MSGRGYIPGEDPDFDSLAERVRQAAAAVPEEWQRSGTSNEAFLARFHQDRLRELAAMRERYRLDTRFHFTAKLIQQFVAVKFDQAIPEWDLLRLTTTIADTWGARDRPLLERDPEGRPSGVHRPDPGGEAAGSDPSGAGGGPGVAG